MVSKVDERVQRRLRVYHPYARFFLSLRILLRPSRTYALLGDLNRYLPSKSMTDGKWRVVRLSPSPYIKIKRRQLLNPLPLTDTRGDRQPPVHLRTHSLLKGDPDLKSA